ncbi:nucleotide-sensitive chloride conductance regulator [Babesia ovis]|uniref:Nucleotide-sensitive chloride conductance regulator n=1 Tax=Babesia ovis TaxID=5869 RepID=A0A9W5TB38_BABOV|nr:nucleotide-sensitive chloride conductance regulator [Babesia ovis]
MGTFHGYQKNIELNDDGTPVLNNADNEQFHATFTDVVLKFNENDHGSGTIYVTSGRIIWIAKQNPEVSYSFPYLSMVLHAISKDKALYKTPCIFIQLQGDGDEEGEGEIPIVIFAPMQTGNVEAIFEAISHMNSLIEPAASDLEDESDFDEEMEEE